MSFRYYRSTFRSKAAAVLLTILMIAATLAFIERPSAHAILLEHIVNGDFETGNASGWTIMDGGTGTWTVNDGTFDPEGPLDAIPPISGKFDIMSNQPGPGTHVLSQPFTVPNGITSATASWKDRIFNWANIFSDPNQEVRVEITDVSGNVVLASIFSTNPGDPSQQPGPNARSFDITTIMQSLQGKTVRLSITEQDNLFYFNYILDDISLTTDSASTGRITIIEVTIPSSAQDFRYVTAGPGLIDFSLDDDNDPTLPNRITFSKLEPGSYQIVEKPLSGFLLQSLVCKDPDNGTTAVGREAKIDLDAGETVICTFTNFKGTGGGGGISKTHPQKTVDVIIDADGIASAQSGVDERANIEVSKGVALKSWPTGGGNEGIDMFDNDGDGAWTLDTDGLSPVGDDLHLEDPAGSCPTAVRNGFHDLGLDCKVLDEDGSLFNGQLVRCDFEFGAFCAPSLPGKIRFFDTNGSGRWENGEDIVVDVNNNSIFD